MTKEQKTKELIENCRSCSFEHGGKCPRSNTCYLLRKLNKINQEKEEAK
jgi:hypothetical protein